jgi:hypothetical protein
MLSMNESMDVFHLAQSEPPAEDYFESRRGERDTIDLSTIPPPHNSYRSSVIDSEPSRDHAHDKRHIDTIEPAMSPVKHAELPVLGLRERFLLFLEKEMQAKKAALRELEASVHKERDSKQQVGLQSILLMQCLPRSMLFFSMQGRELCDASVQPLSITSKLWIHILLTHIAPFGPFSAPLTNKRCMAG